MSVRVPRKSRSGLIYLIFISVLYVWVALNDFFVCNRAWSEIVYQLFENASR